MLAVALKIEDRKVLPVSMAGGRGFRGVFQRQQSHTTGERHAASDFVP